MSRLGLMGATQRKPEFSDVVKKYQDAINNETRQIILNKIFKEPRTAAQIADDLGLSRVAIINHLRTLLEVDLIKEVKVSEEKRQYKQEKYYTVNFPVLQKEEKEKIDQVLKRIGEECGEVMKRHKEELINLYRETSTAKKGWEFEDLSTYWRLVSEEFWKSIGITMRLDKPYQLVGIET